MESLEGGIGMVTGGGRGLGASICRVLAGAGMHVICADIREELACEVVKGLNGSAEACLAMKLDVADERSVEAAVAGALSAFGRIDVLVNNAAVDFTLPLEEITVQQWDAVLNVNLRGPFLVTKHVYESMKARRSGHIINIASTASKRAWANASAYHASKWGLLGFSHALHAEARLHHIKVSAVISGGMRTPFLLDRFPDIDTATLQDPDNVAQTVKFLLLQPEETVIPEIMVLPLRETSWP
ncbi:MAG: short-chain dehydrogenase [Nitrospirae bacterium GWD2_57_9]|nr:MAG: short-chain dehydrogenase [Nitrospirae bacterium GWD2_57_9]